MRRQEMPHSQETDVLIIGSGAAGLSTALRLPAELNILVLSKERITAGSTFWAQGGVSAVLDASDTLEAHVQDTLTAGAGLCDPEAVRFTVSNGREAIEWLAGLGVEFTKYAGASGRDQYHLTREGGHSHRRVVHAADATGRAIHTSLEREVCHRGNISVLENRIAVELISGRRIGRAENRCLGAYVLDTRAAKVEAIAARFVVLATGGASKAYLYSSNPDASTGDGIAMAWRAGCRVANMEFMQFHPTCLHHSEARNFLISEAVRGEGGHLILPGGERFMQRFDAREELAPRDVVARAIDHEMKRLGIPCVYLDISHKPADFVREHFPNIYQRCLTLGLDMTAEPLPVVPAAHYTCGGVMTDRRGRSDVPGLYDIGESAFTGLHGANRMASNSLLECLVYAASAAADISSMAGRVPATAELPAWDESRVMDSDEEVVVSHNWEELRRFMWDYVGIVRSSKRLQRALHRVELLQREIHDYYGNFRVGPNLIELRNLAMVSELIIRSALARRESRGLHYTIDYPGPDARLAGRNTVLVPEGSVLADMAPGRWERLP
jgi:L-aspartate oxidase